MQIVVNDTNLFIDLIHAELIDVFLLTGDNLLRKTALKDQVVVRGLLFIFDELVRLELISTTVACIKLRYLLETGTRLPEDACDERFERWSQ